MRADPTRQMLAGLAMRVSLVERTKPKRKKDATTIANPPAPTTTGGKMFIDPVDILTVETGLVGWTSFDASSYVGSGATVVLLDCAWSMANPDVDPKDAYLYVRSASGAGEYIMAHGRSAGDADEVGGGGMGFCPIEDGAFEYTIDTNPFDTGGMTLRLIGYE